jgi:hypothetical protein
MVQGITTQNAAKNQMQFIQMLKEAFNPATTSELKAGPKGLTMSLDPNSEMMKNLLSGPGSNASDFYQGIGAMGSTPAPTAVTPTPTTGGTTPNPFVSGQPSFSASDLAGLTPEILASNLSGALNVVGTQSKLGLEREQLANKTTQELFNMKLQIATLAGDQAYKSKVMENIESEISARAKDYPLGDTGVMGSAADFLAYQKLLKENNPTEVKLYEYAKNQGFTGSLLDFKNSDKTGHQKDYDAAVKSGYKGDFNTWMLDMAKAGAINLGAKVDEKRAMGGVDRENDILKPNFYQGIEKDLSTRLRTDWKMPSEAPTLAKQHGISEEAATKAIQQSLVRREMDAQIKQVYPKATWAKGQGWIVDGKVVVRDPYAK